MRRLLLISLAALALPATAHAATFYVDGSAAPGANPCTAPATPCKTILSAISQARGAGFPGGDRIQVAAGSYAEGVGFGNAADAGDELVGAGSGANPATATIIGGPVADDTAAYLANGTALRNARVRVTAVKTLPVITVSSGGVTLENLAVEVTAAGHAQPVIAGNGPFVARHLTITSAGSGIGVALAGGAVSIADSDIAGGTAGGGASALSVGAGVGHVERSVLRSPATNSFGTVAAQGGQIVLDSTLVLGGASGVYLHAGGSTQVSSAIVRHTTIDAGAPGPGGIAPSIHASAPLGTAHAQVTDSIALEPPFATIGGTVTCTSTDIPPAAGADCGASGGNVASDPATLFANLAGGDYRLKAGSPAVETGAAGALPADESATDLAGSPRVLDGNLDCVARSDKGAYELTGFACIPPAAPPVVPPAVAVDRTAPVISKLSVTNRKARAARATPKGTGFRFTLSEAASVKITLQRRTTGRHPRYVSAGTLPLVAGKQGANTAKFSGRVHGHKLRAAKYRATLVATDRAGNRSKSRTVTFTILTR